MACGVWRLASGMMLQVGVYCVLMLSARRHSRTSGSAGCIQVQISRIEVRGGIFRERVHKFVDCGSSCTRGLLPVIPTSKNPFGLVGRICRHYCSHRSYYSYRYLPDRTIISSISDNLPPNACHLMRVIGVLVCAID